MRVVNAFKGVVNASAATTALLVALVSLVFSLVPTIKPTEPPEKLGGKFENVSIEHNVSLSDYETDILHHKVQLRSYPSGMLVRARVELSGFKARHYRVLAELWDANSGRPHQYVVRVGEHVRLSDQDLRPSASTDAVTFQLWVRNPTHSGRYFVRLRLYDVGAGTGNVEGDPGPLLDYVDTPPFSYKFVEFEPYWSISDFEGDGAYTVNGEIQFGIYELNPPNRTSCLWTILSRGGDPTRGDPYAPDEEHTIARGKTTKRALLSLNRNAALLVLHGCGHVHLIVLAKP
jgi:hypothetical protein